VEGGGCERVRACEERAGPCVGEGRVGGLGRAAGARFLFSRRGTDSTPHPGAQVGLDPWPSRWQKRESEAGFGARGGGFHSRARRRRMAASSPDPRTRRILGRADGGPGGALSPPTRPPTPPGKTQKPSNPKTHRVAHALGGLAGRDGTRRAADVVPPGLQARPAFWARPQLAPVAALPTGAADVGRGPVMDFEAPVRGREGGRGESV
jgi:hypothetical protein